MLEQPEELSLLQHTLLDGVQCLVGVSPSGLHGHLLQRELRGHRSQPSSHPLSSHLIMVEAPVDLAESAHPDHLLYVQLREADVRGVEALELILETWENGQLLAQS